MALNYQNHRLFLGKNIDLSLSSLTGSETPVYVYDLQGIQQRIDDFKRLIPLQNFFIFYAMKANSHKEILQTIAASGLGVDVVSGGELQRAIECKFSADKIIFSGVGKSEKELRKAIELEIKQINVESLPELERIGQLSHALGKKARVGLRINPNVEAQTHSYISTGRKHDKFGLEISAAPKALEILSRYKSIQLVGLSVHIGSQIRQPEVFLPALKICAALFQELNNQGHRLSTFDVGGGLGIDYHDLDDSKDLELIEAYGKMIKSAIPSGNITTFFEPGRILVARYGVLLTKIEYIKKTSARTFAIVDTGMHHLIRPALYQAYHQVLPVMQNPGAPTRTYDIAGPICESSDILAFDREMPELKQGDLLVIADAGAYGASMASGYNLQPPVAEIAIRST